MSVIEIQCQSSCFLLVVLISSNELTTNKLMFSHQLVLRILNSSIFVLHYNISDVHEDQIFVTYCAPKEDQELILCGDILHKV